MLGDIEIVSIEQGTIEVQMFYDNQLILNNPKIAARFPHLYEEVKLHDEKSNSSWYTLSDQAYMEYLILTEDKTLVSSGLQYD